MYDKIFFILIMIISIYVSIKTISNFNYSEKHISLIKEYKELPIENIILTDDVKCPTNYTSLIVSFKWNGNYEGCECQTNVEKTFYFKAFCPKANCVTIPESNEKSFSLWRGNNLCAKSIKTRYEKFEMISKNKILNGEVCPLNHKACGVIDTLNNYLCVKNEDNCPVNFIKFVEEEEIISYIKNKMVVNNQVTDDENSYNSILKISENRDYFIKKLSSADNTIDITPINDLISKKVSSLVEVYNVSKFKDNSFLVTGNFPIKLDKDIVNNNKNNRVVNSLFRVGLNFPCEDILKKASTDKFTKLAKDNFDFTCQEKNINGKMEEVFDKRYNIIDKYSLSSFFKTNNFLKEFQRVYGKTSVSLDNKNKDTFITLYARQYTGYLLTCDTYETGGFFEFLTTEKLTNDIMVTIIIHSVVMIAAILSIILSAFMFANYYELVFKILNLGFSVINVIMPVQIISNSNFVINVLVESPNQYCGDAISNILFKEISNSLVAVEYAYFAILILTILNCLVYIYMIYRWIKPYNQQFQDSVHKYIEMK